MAFWVLTIKKLENCRLHLNNLNPELRQNWILLLCCVSEIPAKPDDRYQGVWMKCSNFDTFSPPTPKDYFSKIL
jgi:hypothetical protein